MPDSKNRVNLRLLHRRNLVIDSKKLGWLGSAVKAGMPKSNKTQNNRS